MKRVALDWFECSIWLEQWGLEAFLAELVTMFGSPTSESSSQYYVSGKKWQENGCEFQFQPKKGVKNSFAYLRLSGRFFQSEHAESRFDFLMDKIEEYSYRYRPSRIDLAIDCISQYGDFEIEPTPELAFDNRQIAPIKTIANEFGSVETYFSGKSDFRLRVYNKLVESPDYEIKYGIEDVCDVWRVEAQLRGESLHNLLEKNALQQNNYQGFIHLVSGQVGRRYKFPERSGLHFYESIHSAYVCKPSTVAGKMNYWLAKAKRAAEEIKNVLAPWRVGNFVAEHSIAENE